MTALKNEKANKVMRIFAAALLGLCMLLFALAATVMSIKPAVLYAAAPLCWLFMLLCFVRGDYGMRSVCLLGLVLVGWFVVSRFFQDKGFTEQSFGFFAEMSIVFGLAFPAARVMGAETVRKFFGCAAAVMLLVLSVSAWIGVYCVVSGNDLDLFNGNFAFYVEEESQRLFPMGLNTNVGGTLFVVGMILDVYLALRIRKRAMRIAAVAAFLGLYWALALTDSRSAEVSLMAACIPGFLLLMGRVLKKENRMRVGVMIAAALAGMLLVYAGLLLSHAALNSWRAAVVPPAAAEITEVAEGEAVDEAAKEDVGEEEDEGRGLLTGGLSGRGLVYQCAMHYIRDNPRILLVGASESKIPMMSFYEYHWNNMKLHLHNSFLETLALLGVFGLLLVAGICVVLLVCSLRILSAKQLRPEDKLLPMLLLMLIVNALAESYLFVPYTFLSDSAFINLFFFLTAGCVAEMGSRPEMGGTAEG